MDQVLVTVEEAGRRLSLGRTKVYELVASGELASITVGKSRRIPVSALAAWVEAQVAAEGRRRGGHRAEDGALDDNRAA